MLKEQCWSELQLVYDMYVIVCECVCVSVCTGRDCASHVCEKENYTITRYTLYYSSVFKIKIRISSWIEEVG